MSYCKEKILYFYKLGNFILELVKYLYPPEQDVLFSIKYKNQKI